ncbi:MAG: hypothetical protein ACLT2T_08945 [Bilophila wadsworthia]
MGQLDDLRRGRLHRGVRHRVPLVRWGVEGAEHLPRGQRPEEVKTGLLAPENRPCGLRQVTQNSTSTAGPQLALVLGAWMLAYYAVEAVATRVPSSIGGTMWGLFFLINMVSGMLIRFAMRKLGIVHLIDGDSMTRLTGWMMEFLLLSTLIGIKFAVVKDYILPIIVLSVVLAVFTLFFILYFGRRVPGYSFERTVMMFGTCTGTIPTRLILLRMVDSELKTTVSVEAGMWNMSVFIFFYVNFIFHGYVVYGWGMPATLGLFALTFLANYIILRVFKLIGPKRF